MKTEYDQKSKSRTEEPIMKNKPNGMLSKTHFKLNNGDFGNFRGPYYEKQTQWYVIAIKIAVEYELSKNIKNTKQSQFEN